MGKNIGTNCSLIGPGRQHMEQGKPKKAKKPYRKPEMVSEKLITFGASCTGMAVGGRKASSGAPDFCSTNKLLS